MKLDFKDGSSVITANADTDTFWVGFNNYLFLRESCAECKYCGTDRVSDITLADYWGVRKEEVPDQQLWYGVSLVMLNSEKGRALLPELQEELVIHKIPDPENAIRNNPSLQSPRSAHLKRKYFFKMLAEKKDFDSIIHKVFRKYYLKVALRNIIVKIIGEENELKIMRRLRTGIVKKD